MRFENGHDGPPPFPSLVTRLTFHASYIILTAELYDIY